MSALAAFSTNYSCPPNTNWVISLAGPWDYVEVASRNGAGEVWYKLGTTAQTTTSNASGTWNLPAATGASRAHDLTLKDYDAAPTAIYAAIAVSATTDLVVTAW